MSFGPAQPLAMNQLEFLDQRPSDVTHTTSHQSPPLRSHLTVPATYVLTNILTRPSSVKHHASSQQTFVIIVGRGSAFKKEDRLAIKSHDSRWLANPSFQYTSILAFDMKVLCRIEQRSVYRGREKRIKRGEFMPAIDLTYRCFF